MDDFDVQLKEKLEASLDVTGNLQTAQSKNAAERAAEKVAEWRRNMDALLDNSEGGFEEDVYVSSSGTGDDADEEIGMDGDMEIESDLDYSAETLPQHQQNMSVEKVEKKFSKSKEQLDGKEKSKNQTEHKT
jgi:hypothetical protein